MPRVKLSPLKHYDFTWRLPVRTSDLNYADHLAAYALVAMLDEVYVRFLKHIGVTPTDLGAPGVSTIHADLQVNYLGEGKMHDELDVELAIRELKEKSMRVFYRFSTEGRPVALAEVGIVCFDYQKRPATFPAAFTAAIVQSQSPD